MNDFSLIDKFKILMNTIVSSPFFLLCSVIFIFVILLFLLCLFLRKKMNKWVLLSLWIVIAVALLVTYQSFFLELVDNLFDNIFMALYFPNLAVYSVIIIFANVMFAVSIFSKKIKKPFKISTILAASLLDMLLILIIDTISKNNINVYETLTVYSNSTLLVLLELSTAIFTSWILIQLLIRAKYKLKKFDKKKYPDMPEIIFDDNFDTI